MTSELESKIAERAKRFNIVSEDAKKLSRAARFGIVPAEKLVDDEKKKQRADRFGLPRPVIQKEEEERRKQRKDRFKNEFDTKLSKRAQRFQATNS